MKPLLGKEHRNLFFFMVSHFCTSMNFIMWRSVYNNFLHDRFRTTEFQRGYLEAIREIPGLAAVLFSAGGTSVSESSVGGLYILFLALGTLTFAFVNHYWSLIFALIIMSTGMHLLMPIKASMSLALGKEGAKAKRLGQVGSAGATASLVGSGLVILTVKVLKYEGIFIVASIVTATGMIGMLLVRLEKGEIRRNRFAVKKKYSLYYALSFLDACRRHIFVTFAVYGLVKIHGASAQTIAVLIFISNGLNVYTRLRIGHLIDRFGEKASLVFSYSLLSFVFLGYAYVSYIPVLYALYCLDNILFGFSVARTTYLDKIAPREDVTAAIAFGITLNHISAVTLLPMGGYLWGKYGYETPFLMGIGILFLSIATSGRIKIATSRKVDETAGNL